VFVAAVYLTVVIGLGRSPTGTERDISLLSLVAAQIPAIVTARTSAGPRPVNGQHPPRGRATTRELSG
jgi:hypothetical protein